jgi:alpha/beta superfamily hydrolase
MAATLAEFWATSHVAGEDEHIDDLRFAIEAIREYTGDRLPVALVGYSYGCSLLASAEMEPGAPMVMIAPTVGTHDYSASTKRTNALLVIAADTDFATDNEQLAGWFATLPSPKQLIRGQWDDHFFRGFEEEVAEMVFGFLREQWECVG